MLKAHEIQIRDPFVLPVAEEHRYYLFGTTDQNCWGPPATGFDCYVSSNLSDWEGPRPAFRPAAGFWADHNFWAPEVHRFQGRYFMFASFKADGRCRGTQILASDVPAGPYRALSSAPVTPPEWECLDGTLFVDDAGLPWIVFAHEWVQVHDGEICALQLAPDFTRTTGKPHFLFRASEAPWVPRNPKGDYITDGPFLHRTSGGELLMLWSSTGPRGYAMGLARSIAGGILCPWRQDPVPLYAEDGGHGMLFRTLAGQLMLTLHTPNRTPDERPIFVPIEETNEQLHITKGE